MKLIDTPCALCGSFEDYVVVHKQNFEPTSCTEETFSARRIPDRIHYQIVKCRRDGLIRSKPVLEESDLADLYAKSKFTYHDESDHLAKTYLEALTPVLSRLPKTSKVLEIGCGNGFLLARLQSMGYTNVFGIEPSFDAIEKADGAVKERIVTGMLRDGIFEPGTFDLILFFQTFDHINNPNDFLKICHSLLAPGGTILAFNHDVESFQARLLGERSPIIDIAHAYLYSQKTMRKIFELNGFDSVRTYAPKNTVSLRHLLRLSPIPLVLKGPILRAKLGLFSGFLNLTVRVGLGNICLTATKKALT